MGFIQAGALLSQSLFAQVGVQAAIKPSDQSISNTSLTSDNDLILPVLANATYAFGCFLDYEGGGAGISDLQWQWLVPAGASLRYTAPHINSSGATILDSTFTAASNVTAATQGAATLCGAMMLGALNVSSTAGTIQLQWAQAHLSGTPTIVHAQSLLALWRVS